MVSWATVHSLKGKKLIVVIEIQSLILYPMIRLINLCFSIKLERINIKKNNKKKQNKNKNKNENLILSKCLSNFFYPAATDNLTIAFPTFFH